MRESPAQPWWRKRSVGLRFTRFSIGQWMGGEMGEPERKKERPSAAEAAVLVSRLSEEEKAALKDQARHELADIASAKLRELVAARKEIASLKDQVDKLKHKVGADLVESHNKTGALRKDKDSLAEELRAAKVSAEKVEKEQAAANRRADELLQRAAGERACAEKSLHVQLSAKETTIAKLCAEKQKLESKVAEGEAKAEKKETDTGKIIASFQSELSMANANVERLKSDLNKANEKLERRKKQSPPPTAAPDTTTTADASKLSDVSAKLDKADAKNKELSGLLAETTSKYNALFKTHSEQSLKSTAAAKIHSEIAGKYTKSKDVRKELRKENGELKTQLEKEKKESAAHWKTKTRLESELASARNEVTSLSTAKAHLATDIGRLRDEMAAFRSHPKSPAAQPSSKFEAEFEAERDAHKLTHIRVASLEERLGEEKRRSEHLVKARDDAQTTATQYKKTVEKLKKERKEWPKLAAVVKKEEANSSATELCAAFALLQAQSEARNAALRARNAELDEKTLWLTKGEREESPGRAGSVQSFGSTATVAAHSSPLH